MRRKLLTGCIASLLLLGGCASTEETGQFRDEAFAPEVADPAFAPGAGPRVAIDGAHHNYHRVDGRYRGFTELLRKDGYVVVGGEEPFTSDTLADIEILVIANAISADNAADWKLPNPSAFTPEEIEAVEHWVSGGGALLLIADHMPMPGAAADLARAFGVLFHDGFAYAEDGAGKMTFSREDGRLGDHPVVEGPDPGAAVPFVTTFTGQALRLAPGVPGAPLLHLAPGSYLLMPSEAWEFDDTTPRIPADGMFQAALLEHGDGRAAFFGEAAMFSAQVQIRENERRPMGMNDPDAPHNARFARNLMLWLAGALPG